MTARIPRRSFARPFVVTLVAAPACYTNTASPPPEPPAQQQPAPEQPRPVVVANPPRPQPPPPTQQPAPADGTQWTVFKTQNGCEAAVKVDCPQGAMCNPPPPRPIACPAGVTADHTLTIVMMGGECMLQPQPVHCPPHTMCNPPPPHKVDCPK